MSDTTELKRPERPVGTHSAALSDWDAYTAWHAYAMALERYADWLEKRLARAIEPSPGHDVDHLYADLRGD